MTLFDARKYKEMKREQWQTAAESWHAWEPKLEEWLGPATELMLDMAGVRRGSRVLDVAAGAGGQTLRAAIRVGPQGYVLATDIAPRLLRFIGEDASRAGLSNVEWREMDGENLTPLQERSFDAVISRLGLIYFPDQHKALTEMHRVLTPGGRVAVMTYASAEHNQFFSLPIAICRRRAHLPPPLPGQPGPFSLGSPGALEEAYRKAGFRDMETRIVSAPLCFSSATECVRFEYESFGSLTQMLSGLSTTEREAAWNEIEQELSVFEGPTGFEGPCELLVAVGIK
jgi:ubiquinone/menaquinone biosynthesis C-methylase UbiE